MVELPFDVIRIIRTYMRWAERTALINKQWLYEVFRHRTKLRKWSNKLKLYSYLRVFGSGLVNRSWESFCRRICGCHRRARNNHFQLTWRAAAHHIIHTNTCQSCGRNSKANVFGTHLCRKCCSNRCLKYTYMINVTKAKALGVPTHILNTIPYHNCGLGGKFRRWVVIKRRWNPIINNNVL